MEAWVGRDGELSKLDFALGEARLGTGRLVLLSGEPGIGKSRTADELSRRASGQGFLVAWGRAWEAEGTPAFWPWIEAFSSIAAAPELREMVTCAREEMPELAALLRGQDARPVDEGKGARFRLGASVARFLATASERAPLLIVLDDLHVADAASLELTAFIARGLRAARVLCVGTTRDASFVGDATIVDALARIAREATTIPLPRLGKDAVLRWIERDAPSLAVDAERLFESSGGNPLFVRELMATWRVGGAQHALPLGLRGAIQAHVDRLSAEGRAMLARGSVLGREMPLDVLRHLSGETRASSDLDALVDEAERAGIVVRDERGALRFVHALVRDELHSRLGPAERSALHRAAAKWFAAHPSESPLAAHHAILGADEGSAHEAVTAVLAAMSFATSKFAFGDAIAFGERARAALGGWLSPRDESELLTALGEARIHEGDRAEGQRLCVLALERAEAVGDGELMARAALAYAVEQRFGRQSDAAELLKRARAVLSDAPSALRARVLARLAGALVPQVEGETEAPLELARSAVAMARAIGDDETRLTVFDMVGTAFPEEFTLEERFALNTEAVALAERLGQVARVTLLIGWQVACWLELGRLDAAWHELELAEKKFELLPPRHRWRVRLMRGMLCAIDGRFAEAEALGHAALADPVGRLFASIQLMVLPYVRGDVSDYLGVDAEVSGIQRVIPGSKLFLSISDAVAGRIDLVRQAMEAARTTDLGAIPGVAQLGWPVVWSGLREHAEFFYEVSIKRVTASPLNFGPGALSTFGPRELLAGRLALLAGKPALAVEHLERTLVFCTKLGARAFLAQAELALAEAYAALGSDEAKAHAAAAHAIAQATSMVAVAARAKALAGEPPRAAPSAPPTSGAVAIERRGEMWSIRANGQEILLKDARGLAYLEVLVGAPHRDVHVLELVGGEDSGDAGPMLDEKAKRAYRERADDLRERLDEATRFGDTARAERAREELEALGEELSRSVGLGGRDKRAASTAERARINVQRRLRDVIKRATAAAPQLGRHLELSVKTGVFCRYAPTWPAAERATER